MPEIRHDIPPWAAGLYRPYRYKVPFGGRGSSKSYSVAHWLLEAAAAARGERVLCTREFQRTIKDSVHKLLRDSIARLGMGGKYDVTERSIRCRATDSEFIFAGLHANVGQIKSLEGVTKCWVEEAETVTKDSLNALIPTIRAPGSEIIVTFNPREEDDAVYQEFVASPKRDSWVIKVNWQDNPFFPGVLRQEMEDAYAKDPDTADWIWGGNFRKVSDAQIFAGRYAVEEFEPQDWWDGPWYGLDWGFATDPLSCHKYWAVKNTLYVEHEAYETGLELNDIADRLKERVPGVEEGYVVWADGSRPETISHVRGFGINVVAADKWPGSVEDGIAYLKSLDRIVIHPRCSGAVKEAKAYSWKKDRVTGVVMPVPVDRHNHFWDDCRYAMGPAIKAQDRQIRLVHDESRPIAPDLDEMEALQPGLLTF